MMALLDRDVTPDNKTIIHEADAMKITLHNGN